MILVNSNKLVERSHEWLKGEPETILREQKVSTELTGNNPALMKQQSIANGRVNGVRNGHKNSSVVAYETKHQDDDDEFEQHSFYLAIAGYLSHVILVMVGYLREFVFGEGPFDPNIPYHETNDRRGYTPLLASFESFYKRSTYRRVRDTFFRPMASVPGARIRLINRTSDDHNWTLKMESTTRNCINLASYNYLGFAENSGPCTDAAIQSIQQSGLASCSTFHELGTMSIHRRLETTVARFLGTEDAITFGMGFATNSLNLPSLVSKGCLVLSDEKNHASLILGLRLSGATVKVFKHNNVDNLEKILRKAMIHGHPRTRRPWKKVLIVVEGVYSMEGSIVKLPEIVAIKKKYGAYLYLDEAHSVGAMGPHGRGVVDYFGLNPRDIDIMMGTFTKSFGSAGGYIGGSKALVDHLRCYSHASTYASSVSPPVAMQVIASMEAIMSGNEMKRIHTLSRNSRYFRRRLQQMGCIVYGHPDSPVVPLMIFFPSKLKAVVNGLYDKNVAVVGVGFPATNMTEERVRFCLSAGHTKEMLDEALQAIRGIADHVGLRYSKKKKFHNLHIEY